MGPWFGFGNAIHGPLVLSFHRLRGHQPTRFSLERRNFSHPAEIEGRPSGLVWNEGISLVPAGIEGIERCSMKFLRIFREIPRRVFLSLLVATSNLTVLS